MKTDYTLKRIDKQCNAIREHADWIIRSCGTFEDWLDFKIDARLPQWAQEHIRGYRRAYLEQIEMRLVYAYFIRGEWLAVTSEKYRQIAPHAVLELATCHGFVWQSDNRKVWSISK